MERGDDPKGDKKITVTICARSKKTIMRGFRPLPSQKLVPPPALRPKTIERIKGFVEEILNNNQLDKQQLFVVNYLLKVVQYHLIEEKKEKDKTYLEIQKEGKKGHRFGFRQEEIGSLNFVVLEKREEDRLKSFQQKLKGKGAK